MAMYIFAFAHIKHSCILVSDLLKGSHVRYFRTPGLTHHAPCPLVSFLKWLGRMGSKRCIMEWV